MICAQCRAEIAEGSNRPTDPVTYCDHDFCNMRCARAWAYARLPLELEAKRVLRRGHQQILTYASPRSTGASIASETLRELRNLETKA